MLLALLVPLLGAGGVLAAAGEAVGPEVSPAARALLAKLNTADKASLLQTEGLTEESVDLIMAHRSSGKKIDNLMQLRSVAHLNSGGIETLLKPFQEAERERARARVRKPGEGGTGRFSGRKMAGERDAPSADEPPAPVGSMVKSSGEGPIGSVRPGYYGELPGFDDLDKLDPDVKRAFLDRINREMCPCGCQNETVAYCLVNDPNCPVVKARARKIYEDVTGKKPE